MSIRRSSFQLALLSGLLACIQGAQASGIERSDQSIAPFFEKGNYIEFGVNYLHPHIKGRLQDNYRAPGAFRDTESRYFPGGSKLGQIAQDDWFLNGALKLQLGDRVSLGFLWDQPWGAGMKYPVQGPRDPEGYYYMSDRDGSTSSVRIITNNYSFLLGLRATPNIQIYGGPVLETSKSSVSLRGMEMGKTRSLGRYDQSTDLDHQWGWMAGAAYEIPEIAMRASLTYRSAINHHPKGKEWGTSALWAGLNSTHLPYFDEENEIEYRSPQSVNLHLQSGVSQNLLLFAGVRWVNWKQSSSEPPVFTKLTQMQGKALGQANMQLMDLARKKAMGLLPPNAVVPPPYNNANPEGFKLSHYNRDQWSFSVGAGYKLSDEWALVASAGYDNGTGKNASLLGPVNGGWSLGLGAKYEPKNTGLVFSAGIRQIWLRNARGQSSSDNGGERYSTENRHNRAFAAGFKIGYRF